ncbi:MAG: 30S ribosomal protein S9 [Candidatus Micrarchaeia archaeon]
MARGKRKKAIARASITPGRGSVRINKMSVASINNTYVREIILEPVKMAGERSTKVDIRVRVCGGGVLGQAQACRTAIARALVDHFEDESLKSSYLERDRSLLVEDSRRTESKKYKGPKARARYQKSYR